jgi:hypothetical protein
MSALTFTVSNSTLASRAKSRSSNRSNKSRKPFCKVCFDAGKPESEFTCHFVKDQPGPLGKVVCPTLLATECRYCRKPGHFKSHCPALQQKQATGGRNIHRRKAPQSRPEPVKNGGWTTVGKSEPTNQSRLSKQRQPAPKITNRFAIDSDSDDEEIVMDYNRPSVGKSVPLQGAWQRKAVAPAAATAPAAPATAPAAPANAAAAAAKPSDKILKRIEEVEAQLAEVREEMDDDAPASTNWADMCDKEDEEVLKLKEEVLMGQLERLRRKL